MKRYAMIQSLKQRSDSKMEKETFGSKIAALRKEKGMTQLELAEKWVLQIKLYQNGNVIYPIQT